MKWEWILWYVYYQETITDPQSVLISFGPMTSHAQCDILLQPVPKTCMIYLGNGLKKWFEFWGESRSSHKKNFLEQTASMECISCGKDEILGHCLNPNLFSRFWGPRISHGKPTRSTKIWLIQSCSSMLQLCRILPAPKSRLRIKITSLWNASCLPQSQNNVGFKEWRIWDFLMLKCKSRFRRSIWWKILCHNVHH